MPISVIQFVLIVTLVNTGLFIIWKRTDLLNMLLKTLFLTLAIYGWFLVFKAA